MIRTQVPKHLPEARKGEREGSKGDVRGGAIKNSRYIMVIEGEDIRGDNSIAYFLFTVVGSIFGVPEEMMAIKVPQNEENSGGGRKGVGSVICRRRANRGSINIKKREQGGVVDPYIIRLGVKRKKRESRKFREG